MKPRYDEAREVALQTRAAEDLRICLSAAVPLWIAQFERLPLDEVLERGRECGFDFACTGDKLLFRSKAGATAAAFNLLAKGLAAAAFIPGGIRFEGQHWEAVHPDSGKAWPRPHRATPAEEPRQCSRNADCLFPDGHDFPVCTGRRT